MKVYTQKRGLLVCGAFVLICLILGAILNSGVKLPKEHIKVTYKWTTPKPQVSNGLEWIVDDPANLGFHMAQGKTVKWEVDIPTNGKVTSVSPLEKREYQLSFNKESGQVFIMGEFYYTIDGSCFMDDENNSLAPDDYHWANRYGYVTIQLEKPNPR